MQLTRHGLSVRLKIKREKVASRGKWGYALIDLGEKPIGGRGSKDTIRRLRSRDISVELIPGNTSEKSCYLRMVSEAPLRTLLGGLFLLQSRTVRF